MENQYNDASFKLWRNILLVNAFLGYCLFYVTRRTCLYSMPMLLQDTTLSFNTEAFGLMNSTQMVFYSVGKIICGILADKTRPKIIFTVGLVLVGLINISFGFSTSVLMFIVLQALNGLFQGCGWAPIAVLIKRWYRPTELGTIWAILSATMNISSSVIPLIMATLSDYLHWSRSFFIVGVTAILFSFVAYVSIKDNPSEVCTETDINMKQKNNKALNSKVPFIEIFKSEFIWLMSLSYFIWSSVKSGLEDWLQLYLINERHFTKYQASFGVMYFQFGGLLACVSSGIVSDKLMMKFEGKMKSSPRLPVILFCSAFIIVWLYLLHFVKQDSLILINITSFFLGFCCYGPYTLFGLLVMENAPPGLSGSAHSLASAASTTGSVFAGYPLTYFSNTYGWNGVFIVMAIVAILNSIILMYALTVDTGKSKAE